MSTTRTARMRAVAEELATYRHVVALDEPLPFDDEAPAATADATYSALLDHLLYTCDPPLPLHSRASARTDEEKRALLRAWLTVRGPQQSAAESSGSDGVHGRHHRDHHHHHHGMPVAPKFSPAWLAAHDRLLAMERARNAASIVDAATLPTVSAVRRAAATPPAATATCFFDDIVVWRGDLTRLRADAVVNAANENLLGCFQPSHKCIDNVLHAAAGPRMRDDCARIRSQAMRYGTDRVGSAKVTRAYHLPARFVLHTVGPNLSHRASSSAPTAMDQAQLASCYRSCLDVAAHLAGSSSAASAAAAASSSDVFTVAFCCVSTGLFGFDSAVAAKVALSTVRTWIREAAAEAAAAAPASSTSPLSDGAARAPRLRIVFCVFTERDEQVYAREVDRLSTKTDAQVVEEDAAFVSQCRSVEAAATAAEMSDRVQGERDDVRSDDDEEEGRASGRSNPTRRASVTDDPVPGSLIALGTPSPPTFDQLSAAATRKIAAILERQRRAVFTSGYGLTRDVNARTLAESPSFAAAVDALRSATHVLIAGGAGLSAAAGLDYTDESLFAQLYPAMHARGHRCMYEFIGFTEWTPEQQWGYMFDQALNARFSWPKTPVYQDLLAIARHVDEKNTRRQREREEREPSPGSRQPHRRPLFAGSFVFTTNADGMFEQNGFDSDRVCTVQGDYSRLQCLRPCRRDSVWPMRPFLERALRVLDRREQVLTDEGAVPTCPRCGGPMMLNVRGGEWFIEDDEGGHLRETRTRWTEWMRGVTSDEKNRLVVLEIGCGFNTPGVIRVPMERLAGAKNGGGGGGAHVTLVRVNGSARHAAVPKGLEAAGKGVGVVAPADVAVKELKVRLCEN